MRTRRHALGQNFLHHKPTIQKILDRVETELRKSAQPPKALLEVGPGKLALTTGLSAIAQQAGLPLILVERDRYLEEGIRAGIPNAETHFMDAATERFTALFDELRDQGKTPVFVASNLPYSASSPILANICYRLDAVSGAVVMVQKELAKRMVAGPGTSERGALSLLIQSYFEVEIAFDVGPGAFSPPPKVMSTVLVLRPLANPPIHEVSSPAKFEQFCKGLFSQRRKMIRNLIPNEKHELFPKLDISGTERPETLSLTTIIKLYQGLFEGRE